MSKIFGSSVPSVERVKFRGAEVETRGLSLQQLITLLERFPSIAGVLEKNKSLGLSSFADEVVNAIIATAVGAAGDPEEEAAISSLALGEKAAFIAAVIRLTAPDCVGPFVDLVNAIGAAGPEEKPIRLRSNKSQEPPQNSASRVSTEAA